MEIKTDSRWCSYKSQLTLVLVTFVLGPLVWYRHLDGKWWQSTLTTRGSFLDRFYPV